MTAEIHIYGSTSKLTGDFPLDEVREATSWLVDGHKYAKAYKKGVWDGRKHLFNSKTGAFPTGLVKTVAGVLSAADVDYNTVDHRTDPASIQGDVHITGPDDAFRLHGVSFTGKYDYQATACRDMVLAKQGIVRIATNGGKCLAPETLVLRYDGTQVAAQDVQLGDKLMGPDSEPRNVLATTKDRGPMYRIIPNKGEPWDCNDVHVLTLVHTVTGKVVDIPLNEYLQQTNTFKHCHKLFQPDVVVFENPVHNLPVDPYFAGLWLGDGRKSLQGLQITTADHEIVAYLHYHMRYIVGNGSVSKSKYQYSDECPTYGLVTPRGCRNPLLEKMRSTFTRVRIPHEYLTSTYKNRVSLLAGLVDSNGYHHNGSYEITQKRKGLAEDICFLARSLGFRATMKAKVVKQFDPKGVTYWRVSIVGDLSQVPVILDRKKAYPRKHKWNALRQGFKVEPLGTGDYAGFELDGNGRFLLGDFTVTHNTEIACGVTKYLDVKTLFIVTSKDLLHQARARFAERLGLPLEEIGIIGDSHWEPGEWVTISTLDTLESRMDTAACQRFLKSIELMFVDECVDPDAVITTASGHKQAKNLIVGDDVVTKDGISKVSYVGKTHGPGVTITTQYGVPLTVSAMHPVAIFTDSGDISFVHASMLTSNDILVEYTNPTDLLVSPEAYLVGLFAGDGCWHTPNAVRWSFRKDVDWWVNVIKPLVERTFLDASVNTCTNARGDTSLVVRSVSFLALLQQEGFTHQVAKTGSLPVPKTTSLSYIGGLFDAEGNTDSSGRIHVNTTDKSLLYYVVASLRAHNVEASYQHIPRENPKHSDIHRVTIPAVHAQLFHALCGTRMSRKQVECSANRMNSNRGVGALCKKLGIPGRRPSLSSYTRIAHNTTYKPVAINSISYVANHEFVTLEVEDSHTYVAQNLLQHNCHHVGSETWYTVSTLCDAFYRFGLSGTPLDRADGANLRLVAATGDLIVDISNKFLVDRGVSARANIVFDKISGPALKKGSRYNTVYKQGVVENEQLNDKVIEWTKLCVAQNLSVLVLIEEIGHGRQLDEALWTKTDGVFIPHQFIWGDETTEVRTEALQDFGERKLPVLIASTILDEGVDVPTIDVIILAGSRKSKIRTLQRLGRGLRGDKLIVIEFSNFCHHFLLDHSLKRFRDYKNEECFPMFHSSPDAALIKRLWDA